MLLESHRLACLEFNQSLTHLMDLLQDDPNAHEQLPSQIGQLQQQYQQQIAPILMETEVSSIPQGRSLATEFQRSLRLLETDGLFFKAAKSPAIQQQRLKGLCDRLQTLRDYCQVILQSSSSRPPAL